MEKDLVYHILIGLSGILSVGLLMVVILTTNCALLQALAAVSIAAVSCLTMRGHEIIDETEEDIR